MYREHLYTLNKFAHTPRTPASFWRTFHQDGKISPGWWGTRVGVIGNYGGISLKFILAQCHVMCTAVLIGWHPATPLSPRNGDSYTRALLVSKDIRHLFVTPWWGACQPPFTISTITYKVVVYVYAPAERTETLFLLYPYMYVLCDYTHRNIITI